MLTQLRDVAEKLQDRLNAIQGTTGDNNLCVDIAWLAGGAYVDLTVSFGGDPKWLTLWSSEGDNTGVQVPDEEEGETRGALVDELTVENCLAYIRYRIGGLTQFLADPTPYITLYTMCQHCDHFVDEEDPVVHLDDGEKEHDHNAEPGKTRTMHEWQQARPDLFIKHADGKIGPNSVHHFDRNKVKQST